MSKTFIISFIVITAILVSCVAFLFWGYFTNQATIKEQKEVIAEQGMIIDTHGILLAEQSATIEQQGAIVEDLELNIQFLESENIEVQARVEALEVDWDRLEALGGYREFGSISELKQWLSNDQTSENEYIPDIYDCDDFTMDLTLAAIRDGRWIGLFATDNGEAHLKNFTKIGNNIYEIEPQTDEVSFWGYVD